jgi:FlaA1/EpsC-like NDP-sugar epimerase
MGTENPSRISSSVVVRLARLLRFLADVFILAAAFVTAYELRFDFAIPVEDAARAELQIAYVVAIQVVFLWAVGARSLIWRYVGMAELAPFAKAACASAAIIAAARLWPPTASPVWRVPVSVIVISTLLGFGGSLGLRVIRRLAHERHRRRRPTPGIRPAASRTPVLLIGAGSAGVLIAKEIQSGNRTDLEIRGFVDDNPALLGGTIQGIGVVGTTKDLPRLVAELEIECVVISIVADGAASVGLSRRDLRRIRDICDAIPVKVRIVPAMHELLTGHVSVSQIRDMQVEDLLGREPVRLETLGISALLEGHTVMVTGAGGSIGSELARQVARFRPARLVLVERAEPALFTIEQELRASFSGLCMAPVIGDVGDASRMRTILERYSPRVVLHAAAHKHVPLMESNPTEAIVNNVFATRLLGELAGQAGVERFVLISTDKAVRPSSVMGASKRFAEIVVQDLNEQYETRYMAVRFGNVMGSTGSVIPIFREQIRRGGPVTVTHPSMMRYFMTIPEAAQLVLQAAALGEGGEIFILDMGEPVSILGLAIDTIRLSGLEPYEDIDIEFVGPRPGEKLVEELDTSGEEVEHTPHPKILIGHIRAHSTREVREALRRLEACIEHGSDLELRCFLNTFLAAELDLRSVTAPDADLEPVASALVLPAQPVSAQA